MRDHIKLSSGQRVALFATLTFSAGAGIAACSSDTNQQPPTTFTTSSGSSAATTSSAAGSSGSSATTGAGGATATGAGGATVTGAGGATVTGASGATVASATATATSGTGGQTDCIGTNDCYKCAPKTGPQFLNACTDSQCSPFDNVARLPLYNNGNLPAIQ